MAAFPAHAQLLQIENVPAVHALENLLSQSQSRLLVGYFLTLKDSVKFLKDVL